MEGKDSVKPYYQDDLITLYHGDCYEMLPQIQPFVDLVFMDPPYGHNQNDGDLAHMWESALGQRANTPEEARPIANDSPKDASRLVRFLFAQSNRLLDSGCCCCCCCCGGGGIKPHADDHPTPKPVQLPAFFIRVHTDPDDLVLDPVCGAGTTLVAAKNLGRHAIGIEIDERWCELAAKRLSQETIDFMATPAADVVEQIEIT